ncbi:hypothetical protein J7E52_03035 [Bacillus sp. ISL-34]|uniref:hypothetical protein n=1 Tax=Bacillus sp. ISL-34 TaxID=2819121 RepID=UPI001BE955C1|nr:hypothetical protein [Bacillus sp. ISL-34]MBT2645705.1 hypothetical protein [Bacillus sp. ISL-34]
MTHIQKADLHVQATKKDALLAAPNVARAGIGPLVVLKGARSGPHAARKGARAGIGPLAARKGVLAGNDPLPALKGALAGNGDRHAAHKGAPAENGVLYAADKGGPAETGVPPNTAGGSAAITFAINGNGASSFMVPF